MIDDRSILFGAMAHQVGLISTDQLAEAISASSEVSARSLFDVLVDRGWLVSSDCTHIEYLVDRRLARFGGDVRASILDCSKDIQDALAILSDDRLHSALNDGRETIMLANIGRRAASAAPESNQRYTFNALHAAGGIGEIWRARDADLDRDVAVKRLHPSKTSSDVATLRFLREARITGQLDHPGVVPIYEICMDPVSGQPYYSMRFLKGRTLTEAVEDYHGHGSIKGGDTRALLGLLNSFVIVCNTVAYAHSKNIIHRDLKCDNVILGDYGEVVVIDWGLAKEVGDKDSSELVGADDQDMTVINPVATLAGHILGSPAYMAPEQAAGRLDLVGPASDIYGLSSILYEILCGRPPFLANSIYEILQKVQYEPPQRPSEIATSVPEALETICLKGLAKSPDDRFATADDLATEVHQWVSDLAERRQSEEERERFFALSRDLLAIVDDEGRLRQISPAWERLLGYERLEVSSHAFTAFLHPDERNIANDHVSLGGSRASDRTFEARAIHRDGTHRWISWNITPIAKENCSYVVGRDITELKRSQQLFEGVLQSAPDAMVLVNRQGRIVMVNQQTERIFGYEQGELLGQPIEVLLPERYRAEHPARVAHFFAKSSFRPMGAELSLRGLRKNGDEFAAEIALSPINAELGPLVAASVRDITDRKPHREYAD